MLTYDIDVRVLPARYTAVVRGELPPEELPAWLAGVFHVVWGYLRDAGIPRTGYPFARYTFLRDAVAVEAGFPVACEVPGDGVVEPSLLPGGPAAVTTHLGGYEELDQAYAAVHGWIRGHDREPAGPHWEIYYTNPDAEPDPARWRTDVVVPFRASRPGRTDPVAGRRARAREALAT